MKVLFAIPISDRFSKLYLVNRVQLVSLIESIGLFHCYLPHKKNNAVCQGEISVRIKGSSKNLYQKSCCSFIKDYVLRLGQSPDKAGLRLDEYR